MANDEEYINLESNADQILFEGPSSTTLDLVIERTIEYPHALNRTRDGARAHTGGIMLFSFLLV
jgi:hypothetical protein